MAIANTGVSSDGAAQGYKVGCPGIVNTPLPGSYGAGNQTYTTDNILGGIIVHDGTGNANGTLPTAALLVAAIPLCVVGDTCACLIINGANVIGGGAAITLVAGTGGSFDVNQGGGSRIIAFSSSKYIYCRVTNTNAGSQAYTVYS